MNDLKTIISYFQENYPNAYSSLNFITDEWISNNSESPWILKLINDISRLEICKNCKAEGGIHLDTNICSEACPEINVASSNYYKKIILSDVDCPIYNDFIEEKRNKEKLASSGITEAMMGKTLKGFDAYNNTLKEAFNACLGYVESYKYYAKKGIGIYIYSKTPGNGKSHLTIATGMDVFRRYGVIPKYCNLVELNNTYKSKLNEFGAFSIVPEIYLHDGLLIIDDIGTEVGTARVGEIAYAIVHYRYDHNLPTIYSSNYNLEQLQDRYMGDDGIKIVDRIKGRCPIKQIIAPSYRDKELELLLK